MDGIRPPILLKPRSPIAATGPSGVFFPEHPVAGRGEAGRHTAATVDDLDFIDGAKRGAGRLAGAQRPKAANHANGHLCGLAPWRENSPLQDIRDPAYRPPTSAP
jgi:hypothetical protein